MGTLRPLLGDQLNENHSWFGQVNPEVTYLLMEVREEASYVRHHIQKVVAIFLAMRAFAERLEELGHQVKYLRLDDEGNQGSLAENIKQLVDAEGFDSLEMQEPDEWRIDQKLRALASKLEIPVSFVSSEHFYTERGELAEVFKGRKTYVMEHFYRTLRRKHQVLMDGDEPMSGRWNYDEENRESLPDNLQIPPPWKSGREVAEIVALLERAGIETMGRLDPTHFVWPVTRTEALHQLGYFCDELFGHFGPYQDAMTVRDDTLFHSRLSFVLNVKLLSPNEVVETAISTWDKNSEQVSFASLEGFVRQIIGWREYVRGIYWARMPEFSKENFFENERKLPDFYWTGETDLNCLNHSLSASLDGAHAHHIQRLMVLGNYALLIGAKPDEVDRWYLGVYIDAFEWVELPNTRGMSQYADGGKLATKPYVSSGNYINKMSDYCKGCRYAVTKRTGEGACPFNSLYWHFLVRHENRLRKNPRIARAYSTWERMKKEDREATLAQAEDYLASLG